MIAAWMLFSLVTGCALTAAAAATDHIAFLTRRPRRFIWLTTLIVTSCWPAMTLIRAALFPLRNVPSDESLPTGTHVLSAFAVSVSEWDVYPHLSSVFLVVWGLISCGLIARIVHTVRQIERHRDGWQPIEIDGSKVHLSTDVGPAVIGFRPMRVVLPEWVLGMDTQHRALIVRHEEEHRAARDPYLLLVGTLITALVPWNLPLWFQMRRMRLAIELDCDARVLKLHPPWQPYALLLLAIAQRRTGARQMFAPALSELSESTSNLERRITAMRTTPQLSRFRAVCLSLAATAAFALACAVDKPESPDTAEQSHAPANQANQGARVQSMNPATTTFFEFQVDKPAVARKVSRLQYPASMNGSGISGELLAQYVVDETGRVDMQTFKALKSPGLAFTAVVKAALPQWRFHPAVVGGKEVKQIVQQAFIFRLPADA